MKKKELWKEPKKQPVSEAQRRLDKQTEKTEAAELEEEQDKLRKTIEDNLEEAKRRIK